jgi:hypothetical protein
VSLREKVSAHSLRKTRQETGLPDLHFACSLGEQTIDLCPFGPER